MFSVAFSYPFFLALNEDADRVSLLIEIQIVIMVIYPADQFSGAKVRLLFSCPTSLKKKPPQCRYLRRGSHTAEKPLLNCHDRIPF
jgi:hypothetical protein